MGLKAAAKKAAPKKPAARKAAAKKLEQMKAAINSGEAMLISNGLAKHFFGRGVTAETEVADLNTGVKIKLRINGADGHQAYLILREALDEFNGAMQLILKEKQLSDHFAGVTDRILSEDQIAELQSEIKALKEQAQA